jgi:hypothetical protein
MQRQPEFLTSGVIFGNEDAHEDFMVIHYNQITSVEKASQTDDINIFVDDNDDENDPYSIKCRDSQECIDIMRELRKRVSKCLEQDAVQREEDRAFRASLLAHLGKLTERIAFEPDVGDEALDAIDRCKKRARDGEE